MPTDRKTIEREQRIVGDLRRRAYYELQAAPGEKFDVLVNGEPVKFIQSRDDEGNWHVAFDVDSSTQDVILISGFENPNVDVSPSGNDLNYAPFLYVIPVVAAIGIGAYFYKRKN